jgi:hypothetical protein
VVLTLAVLGSRAPVLAQDSPPSKAEIAKLIATAREGSPPVRPQAAERLLAMGEPAAAELRELAGTTSAELAHLGSDLVEVLARFGDPALRAREWDALGAPDFPWRPAAARSLAAQPAAAELERFVALLADPLPLVRVAALTGLEHLDARTKIEAVRARLADDNDRVRREAARLLDLWGEHAALGLLVEELRRDDAFFRNPTGRLARADAARLLAQRLGDLGGYRPEKDPSDPENRAAIDALLARCRELAGGTLPELPSVARATSHGEGDLFGLEIRSCRRGELFLRWNASDHLLVGTGNPVTVDLPPGTVAGLREPISALLAELGETRVFGIPGCDVEQFHWQPEADAKDRTIVVSKGPEPIEGVRPQPLRKLYALLVASIPEQASLPNLRERVVEALTVVGGPLSGD